METGNQKTKDAGSKTVETTIKNLNAQEIAQVTGGAGNRKTTIAGTNVPGAAPVANKANFYAR